MSNHSSDTKLSRPSPALRTARIALFAFVAVVVAGTAFVAIAAATDRSSFCGSTCHEMKPYHQAWSTGPHKDVPCIACHVGPKTSQRLAHKFVALQEVVDHFAKSPSFPLAEPPVVPDERCVTCHTSVKDGPNGFSHAQHAAGRACVSCHAEAGHSVTTTALADAGILNPANVRARATVTVASVGAGRANLPGHVTVACSRCHDLAATPCSACHQPPHKDRGACTTCHATGTKFVFRHPARTDCATCHQRPAQHVSASDACSSCHRTPGTSWAFTHPTTAGGCESCHARPGGHRAGSCTTCHSAGISWAFRHPASGASCATCHARPSGHRTGVCTTCHATGTSWAFRHPGSGASCATCHARPSGHRAGSCTTCHATGTNWAFRHPSSRTCSTCHNAPANHFGSSCATCHSPSRPWASAVFNHGSIPGGQHTYRSFTCTTCHPSGYSSYTCARCHGNQSGPSGD